MGNFVGNLFGVNDGRGDAAEARAANQRILENLQKQELPDIEKMKIALQNPELVGLLEAEQLDPSAMEDIQLDPRLREAQMGALSRLQERATQGLTDEDRAMQEMALQDVAAQEMSQRASIEQEMQRRGTADSGTALMAKLQGQQAGGNQARRDALMRMAQGSQQRMAADAQSAGLAGQIGQQQFGQQSQVADARDRIAQANAMNRQGVNAQNLASRQGISDRTTDMRNQEQMFNKGLLQQDFQNRMTKAGAENQATGNIAADYANKAAAGAQARAGLTSAIIGGGAAIAASDIRVKTDIESGDSSIETMLDKLSPYEYDYTDDIISEDPSYAGRNLGVMAQDLEKSALGDKFVMEDDRGVKRVDYGKMGSTQMAALANIHQRLKKLEGR